MNHILPNEYARPGWFGHRKLTARACIADSKKHLRTFLSEALEDLGFITSECADAGELDGVLDEHRPDLLVLGVSVNGVEIGRILETLVKKTFAGKVLIIGHPETIMVKAVRQIGEEYHIDMLPPLPTPFSAGTLRDSVVTLLPQEPAPSPAVDVAEALKAGWLELWYQQKINLRTLVPLGAEALVRMRHPAWGVVPPAYFIPDVDDPHFHALSDFVISRAIEDWHYLLEQKGPVDLSINLPASFLRDPAAVRELCRKVPEHPAFGGLLFEITSKEVVENLDLIVEVARQVRLHNIAISVDNVGTEWPSLMGLKHFPFVELKVDQQFVTGAADDRLKQTVCRHIIELAHDHGARVLAQGVETRADFLTAHGLGFDLVQGYLFGKPMGVKKFARARPAATGSEPKL
ncbi:MAG: EAL domain-containing response regulator [Rhizobiales bacterium]|nr:EAL domain-containing response regulator [Hyphomicrobiales bacterium]